MASSPEQAVQIAVMAGVDMSMVPYDYSFAEYLLKLVKANKVPMNRINDAVARILRVKFLLGVFDNPYPSRELQAQFGTEESAQISQAMAGEGITLLKNEQNLLPLSKNSRILVTGPAANSLAALNGGWTITWQGGKEELYPKNKLTILAALRQHMSAGQVDYFKGVEFHEKAADYDSAIRAARNADVVVLCLGEKTYTETPGNIDDLTLDSAQVEFAKELYRQGKPVVLVLVEGRPRVIREIEPGAAAIVMAYLPGMEGAPALAKILTGVLNPSGKLPFSYPRFVNSTIPYDHKYQEEADGNTYNPQWPFGFGLSYTKFSYRDITLSDKQFDPKKGIRVRASVTNDGDVEGQEVVQLYLSDVYRKYSTPPVKQLIDFRKIKLAPKETKVVEFNVQLSQLSYVAPNYKRIVERGDFKFQVANLVVPFSL
jgi:beta-glucosidase